MDRALIGKPLTAIGTWTASPTAFGVVVVYVLAWVAFDRQSLDYHGVATVLTWLMTLFIQRAEHRDTQAIQAKLDEILKAHGEARNELTRIDEREPEEIEAHRAHERET
jgi:low affinity Fe/Cu permease